MTATCRGYSREAEVLCCERGLERRDGDAWLGSVGVRSDTPRTRAMRWYLAVPAEAWRDLRSQPFGHAHRSDCSDQATVGFLLPRLAASDFRSEAFLMYVNNGRKRQAVKRPLCHKIPTQNRGIRSVDMETSNEDERRVGEQRHSTSVGITRKQHMETSPQQ